MYARAINLTKETVSMDKTFLQVMCLMAFVFMGQIGGSNLNAKESPSVRHHPTAVEIERAYENVKEPLFLRKPPTAAEIEKAYENCLKHECEDFAEWSIKAAQVCSEGGQDCCEQAREILAAIDRPQKEEVIYDNYFPHSFPEDDEPENAP